MVNMIYYNHNHVFTFHFTINNTLYTMISIYIYIYFHNCTKRLCQLKNYSLRDPILGVDALCVFTPPPPPLNRQGISFRTHLIEM